MLLIGFKHTVNMMYLFIALNLHCILLLQWCWYDVNRSSPCLLLLLRYLRNLYPKRLIGEGQLTTNLFICSVVSIICKHWLHLCLVRTRACLENVNDPHCSRVRVQSCWLSPENSHNVNKGDARWINEIVAAEESNLASWISSLLLFDLISPETLSTNCP